MRRRNATRGGSHRKIAKADSVSIVGKEGKGPTIVLPVSQVHLVLYTCEYLMR